jgi:sulfoxide reductase heme-binding subunit YedZ
MGKRWAKVLIFLLCLAPLGLGWYRWNNDLIPNPIEFLQHFTGDWAIRLIVVTLAITPLRQVLHLPSLIRFRRMIGLFAFFYATLHFTTYLWLDKNFELTAMLRDVGKRPFITVGFASLVLMIPLAVTSTAGWIRRLGGKRWQMLHRLVYASGVLAVVHYYWLVKSDVRLPLLYGALVALLLAYRVIRFTVVSRPSAVKRLP